jgi:hypothetical protein
MLTNDNMKPGRFLKLQNGRNRMAWIQKQLALGRRVIVSTHLHRTIYSKPEQFKMDRLGYVYAINGKAWNCIDFSNLTAQ